MVSRPEAYGWDGLPIPPRLTPSPPPEIEQDVGDTSRVPTPPIRLSIYPHPHADTWHVNVVPSDYETWSSQFQDIRAHLHDLFDKSIPPVHYLSIEHIGSTAVPGLAAKPNIDVLATFPSEDAVRAAIAALNWEIPSAPPFAKYTQIPRGGGIPGRES